MDAIVTAGGIPLPGEPLYEYTGGQPKALLDVAGKPMVQWVLDALDEAEKVDQVVVVGLQEDSGVTCSKSTFFVPDQAGMLQNVRAGVQKLLELNPTAHHVLTVSSDIPAITGEMVDWTVNACLETDHDLYYNVITREVMEARYPNSKRSYIRLKNMEVCGGDMNAIRAKTVTANEALWERIIEARKNVFKQAALVGYDTLLLLLLRQMDIERGVKRVGKKLDISGRVLFCPFAEIGMDIDKPHQLEILRVDLARPVNA
jgi:GTP:adenosylcobinamide-phosphate guanylyltransferase